MIVLFLDEGPSSPMRHEMDHIESAGKGVVVFCICSCSFNTSFTCN